MRSLVKNFYTIFLFCAGGVVIYSGDVFTSNLDKNKIYVSLSMGPKFLFAGDILNKYENNYTPSINPTDNKFSQSLSLPNVKFAIGYQFWPKLGLDLNIGLIHYPFHTKANILDGFNIRYATSFLNLDNMQTLFSINKTGAIDNSLKDLLLKSQIMRINIDIKTIPIYLGAKFQIWEKNNWKLHMNCGLGMSIVNVKSFVNFNFVEMIEKTRNDINLKTHLLDYTRQYKNLSQNTENIENIPKKLLDKIAYNAENLSMISHSLDYYIKFKTRYQFYTGAGINLTKVFLPGMSVSLGVMVDYLLKLNSLEIDNTFSYEHKALKEGLGSFLGIKYTNKSLSHNLEIDSHMITFQLNLGINFYL